MLLQPFYDPPFVTVNSVRRHDIVLAEMKTFVFTFTCKNKTSDQTRGFIKPPLHLRGGNPSTSVGGFSFGIFAPIGAIQPEEVAINKVGLNLNRSKIAFQSFIRKESIS
jgi:hypothetical protein